MSQLGNQKNLFGTMPVFMATISTILGAILFLRFGYAVGHVGFWGTMKIIAIGHLVTIATALAVSEIATNQKVEGGGAYFMISRSFGLNIGAAVGIALFIAQAISVAFYVIAFAEAFDPIIHWLKMEHGIEIYDKRMISLPAMALLTMIILIKGADLGVKALYVVVAVLFVSLGLFFAGTSDYTVPADWTTKRIENPDSFFYVFTIIFPAFTGIAAGLGLSGDLKDPKKSIPRGTFIATIFGMLVYVAVTFKLVFSASPEELANDQLVMSKLALWGPAIPIGLACATISSAIGSVMIAPRTLQALGADKIFPMQFLNRFFKKENKQAEPFNAAVITCLIAFAFVGVGELNFVAEIISMFFMVTYGVICVISFLEHFAADPSYRPTFRSRWYVSLIGAIACFWLMFQMNFTYALLSVVVMVGIYIMITYFSGIEQGLSRIFQGTIFQASRRLQVFLQKADTDIEEDDWRPAVVCVSKDSFQRYAAIEMLGWISYKYGFGTYIHHVEGYLSKQTNEQSKEALQKLFDLQEVRKSRVYFDTIVSPSYTTAIAQVIQLPGMTGKENNTLLLEFNRHSPGDSLESLMNNFTLIKAVDYDVLLLGSTNKGFGYKKNIHIWITDRDFENANLMILLGFIILGHPGWKKGQIKLLALSPEDEMEHTREDLSKRIADGRLPISANNIQLIPRKEHVKLKQIINMKSNMADLTIIGFRVEAIKKFGAEVFEGYDEVGNILFVNTTKEKEIK